MIYFCSNANLFMSYVIREGRPLPIDLYKLMNEGDMDQNIVMRGGDKIFIANDANDYRFIIIQHFFFRPIYEFYEVV